MNVLPCLNFFLYHIAYIQLRGVYTCITCLFMRKLQQCFYSIVFIHSCGLNHQLQQGKKIYFISAQLVAGKENGTSCLARWSLPGLNIRDHPNACIESHDIVFTLLSLQTVGICSVFWKAIQQYDLEYAKRIYLERNQRY